MIVTIIFALSICLTGLLYIKLRDISNIVLASASKDFFDATNSLMETPNDIPDELIEVISIMNNAVVDPDIHKSLLRSMKKPNSPPSGKFQSAVNGMRPELRDLLTKAVVSWFNIVSHKSVITNIRISLLMKPSNNITSDPTQALRDTGINTINNMGMCTA